MRRPIALTFVLAVATVAAAAPTTTPSGAVSGATVTVGRTVVDDQNAVACLVGGKGTGGDTCPLEGPGVGIAPLEAGPVKLATGPLVLAAGNADEMCGWQRTIRSFDRAATVDTGRVVSPIALPSSTYAKIIADHTKLKDPRITQLAKVDLEGDGKDEVLFTVDSGDTLYDAAGDGFTYTWVGVRRIGADGQVKTHILFTHQARYAAANIANGEIPVHIYGKILGLTDIDGDKTLEVVVEDGFYEGRSRTVYRVTDAGPVNLGGTGCGA